MTALANRKDRPVKKQLLPALAVASVLVLAACSSSAVTVSKNLSNDADAFKVTRQIVFHNDITDTYLFEVTGLCSLGNNDTAKESTVTCKIGADTYVKEIIRTGDNVSVTAVQTQPTPSDPYHYEVFFRPSTIVPNIQTK